MNADESYQQYERRDAFINGMIGGYVIGVLLTSLVWWVLS